MAGPGSRRARSDVPRTSVARNGARPLGRASLGAQPGLANRLVDLDVRVDIGRVIDLDAFLPNGVADGMLLVARAFRTTTSSTGGWTFLTSTSSSMTGTHDQRRH